MLALAPWFAGKVKGHARQMHRFVSLGLFISAACGLLPLAIVVGLIDPLPMLWLALGTALALGVGQAMAISSQAALVPLIQAQYSTNLPTFAWLGTYRFVERLGNAVGPLVASALLVTQGHAFTLMAFGGTAMACALGVYLGLRSFAAHGWTAPPEQHTEANKATALTETAYE